MEAYLSKALWRSGAKLGVGLALLTAIVGLRFVTATPAGLESDLAELERFDAEQAAAAAGSEAGREGGAPDSGGAADTDALEDGANADSGEPLGAVAPDTDEAGLDRLVRCRLGRDAQFMRAADCATRGGELEELPPPPSDEASATR